MIKKVSKSNISAFKLISINQEPANLFSRHFQSEYFKYVHVSFSQKVVKYWSCASNAFFSIFSFGHKDFFLTYRTVWFLKKKFYPPLQNNPLLWKNWWQQWISKKSILPTTALLLKLKARIFMTRHKFWTRFFLAMMILPVKNKEEFWWKNS